MNRSFCRTLQLLSATLTLCAMLPAAGQPAPAPASHPVAIRNVRLFDGQHVIPNATVVFDGLTIKAAGKDVTVPVGAEVIDGSGRTLLPGLIDSHTHAFEDALERALRFGVTTELDMFTSADVARGWRTEQAAGNVATRADIYSASTLVTVPGGHGTEYFKIPTFTPGGDPQAFIDARIAEGSDYIKLIYDDGKAYSVSFPTLTKDDLRALIAAAHKRKKLTVVHIGSLAGARGAIEAGADGLAHLFGDVPPDPAFGKFVAEHHAFVVPTLTVVESASGTPSGASLTEDERLAPYLNAAELHQLHTAFPKSAAPGYSLANALAAVAQLKAAGATILAGTDSPNPGTAHGASIHRELELLVKGGLTPTEALTAATSTPAAVFHLADRGRIAPGLRADLLLVKGDPTVDIHATRDIVRIWKGGVALARTPEVRAKETAVATVPAEKLAAGMISNFDQGDTSAEFGFGWMVSTDAMMGGKSTSSMEVVDGGAAGTPKALLLHTAILEGYPFPWAGAMTLLGPKPMAPVDLSSKKGLHFYAKGDTDIKVMVFAERLGRYPGIKAVHAGASWTEISLPWSDFGLDGKDIEAVLFSNGTTGGKVDFWIDEVAVR
jgi:imidazolonepropionase-like amidohydrolase